MNWSRKIDFSSTTYCSSVTDYSSVIVFSSVPFIFRVPDYSICLKFSVPDFSSVPYLFSVPDNSSVPSLFSVPDYSSVPYLFSVPKCWVYLSIPVCLNVDCTWLRGNPNLLYSRLHAAWRFFLPAVSQYRARVQWGFSLMTTVELILMTV